VWNDAWTFERLPHRSSCEGGLTVESFGDDRSAAISKTLDRTSIGFDRIFTANDRSAGIEEENWPAGNPSRCRS
jgi:hypothetical protein